MPCVVTDLSPVDWQRVLLNIRSAGVSMAALGAQVRADPHTLRRVASGEIATVEFGLGCRLLDAHLEHCRERHHLQEVGR